jgi:hypothetical protein
MARFNPFRKKSLNITPVQPVKNGNSWFYPMYGTGAIRTIRDTATPDGQRTAYQFCPVVTSIVTKKVSAAANGVPYVKNAKDETVTDVRAKRLLDALTMIDLDKAYTMNQVFGRAYIWKRRATGFNGITSLDVLNGWSIADEAAKPYIRYKEENSQVITTIPKSELLIWNDKYMNFAEDGTPMEGGSRLISLKDPVSNIAAVYEGLNMIWTAGGAVGMVSPMTDRMGAIPLTPDQQQEVNQHYSRSYGLNRGKSAVLVSQNPLRWQSTILPVDQLQYIPGLFENTRQVCDVYGVSTMLLGFTNGTTFTNKAEAEKAMYQDAVIPEIDGLCRAISNDPDFKVTGLTLAMDFSSVGSLQVDESALADYDAKIISNAKTLKDTGIYSDNEVREYIAQNCKLSIPQ